MRVCDCNSLYFTKILNGLVGLQLKWLWNPCCVQIGIAQSREHLQWELEPAVVGCQLLPLLWRSSHWAELLAALCSQEKLCKGGKKESVAQSHRRGGCIQQHGVFWTLELLAVTVQSELGVNDGHWNLLAGWGEQRLFPICASVCRRVWLEKLTYSWSLTAK